MYATDAAVLGRLQQAYDQSCDIAMFTIGSRQDSPGNTIHLTTHAEWRTRLALN